MAFGSDENNLPVVLLENNWPTLEEVRNHTKHGGKVSIKIAFDNRKRFLKHIERINLMMELSKAGGGLRAIFFHIYTSVVARYLARKDRGMRLAFWVYETCFYYIETFEGELTEPDDKMIVIFHGKS